MKFPFMVSDRTARGAPAVPPSSRDAGTTMGRSGPREADAKDRRARVAAAIWAILFAPTLAVTLLLSPTALATTFINRNANAPANVEGFRPALAINIPTIQFSGILVDTNTNGEAGITGYLGIPWIGEYVRGVYSYAVVAAVVLAGVMFVVGGFYYLTAGGDASRVQKGRKRIADAIIGLLLVFGAFILLTTLSPGLTSFEELRVKRLKQDPFQQAMEEMFTTHENTINGFGESGAGSGPAPSQGAAPSVGSHASSYSNCPVALTEEATSLTAPPGPGRLFKNDQRTHQFFTMMAARVASLGTLRDRILAVADAAPLCGVSMNSCGSTAGAILSIAGVGNGPACFDSTNAHSCWAQETSGMDTPRGGSVPRSLFFDVMNSKCGTKNGQPCGAADCATDGRGAVARARQLLQTGVTGYPDTMANMLQPGDIVWIYNANGGNCTGLHSIIFLGWASNGKAQVTQGSDGTAVHGGQVCLSTRCNGGNNYTPIVRIYRARGL